MRSVFIPLGLAFDTSLRTVSLPLAPTQLHDSLIVVLTAAMCSGLVLLGGLYQRGFNRRRTEVFSEIPESR